MDIHSLAEAFAHCSFIHKCDGCPRYKEDTVSRMCINNLLCDVHEALKELMYLKEENEYQPMLPGLEDNYYTVRQCSKILGYSEDYMRRILRMNRFPNAVISSNRKGWAIPHNDIIAYSIKYKRKMNFA